MRRRSILLAGFAALAAAPRTASAHAFLRAAIPAVGSTVPRAPATVVCLFTEALEGRFCRLDVHDAASARVDLGDAHVAPDDPKRLTVGLKPIGPGTYAVAWVAVSVDTHRTEGHFTFTVAG